ncbi:DJ-1/PfpI family protein [Pseudomassariella vexata]|uniref:DJ-1/PfpI family protein n=1 Tax=Pseudomassariella vexata TaxID=1141098 RepID=A0A1Y2E0R6_9PEZI|nr:DJ-1/PfpI family protein [Pseudomassariella vexata]ORY64455.1 DJ-1/PfpI family protein [Pseudomassariella vexata]
MAATVQTHSIEHLYHDQVTNTTTLTKWGAIIFRAMLMQDLVGVLDPLQVLAHSNHLELSILAETLDPVTTEPLNAAMNTYNSTWWPQLVPTHTFDTAPEDLEVLIVPGGPGIRNPNITAVTDFIAQTYPNLKYLITICTGAGLAAKAGVLDGRRATTNKGSWATVTAMGPNVEWVSPARWVVDGNIWSSSGVTAGLDLVFSFIEHLWGATEADRVAGIEEYVPHPQDFDPFAAKFNVTSVGHI